MVISVLIIKVNNFIEKKVGVARLKLTRDENKKGTRIGPSLFYTSKLYNKYIKIIEELISYLSLNLLFLRCIRYALKATPILINISRDIHNNSIGAPFLFPTDDCGQLEPVSIQLYTRISPLKSKIITPNNINPDKIYKPEELEDIVFFLKDLLLFLQLSHLQSFRLTPNFIRLE